MKKALLIYSFFLINIQINAQFVKQNSGTGNLLSTIDFADSSHGWAIPWLANYLLKTDDGGSNWFKVNYPYSFNNLKFVDSKTGYAINYWRTQTRGFYKTTNGGISWFSIFDTSYIDYDQDLIFALDTANVWFGIGSKLYKTTDGGQTLSTYSFSETPQKYVGEEINDIFFLDKNVGWIIYFYDIYSTIDGGITWTKLESPKCRNISFINKDVGFILSNNDLLKTENGGITWLSVASVSDNAKKIKFINDQFGFYLDWQVQRTTDSGVTWKQLSYADMIPNERIGDYTAISPNEIWISGENGFIAKYDTSDTTKSITVTSPNGGESWLVDYWQTISWHKHNVESVDLSYSTDNGQSWIKIADSIQADDLTYSWGPIPNTPSANCLIKATDHDNPNIYDESNSVFTLLFNPKISIISPNGGETILGNTRFDIKWISQNVYKVNILLSIDDGISWRKVGENLFNSGSFSWHVPDTTSNYCLIKIEDSDDTSIFDISDKIFNIVPFHSFSYFPLSVGNKWFFVWTGNSIRTILEVTNDTLMQDMKRYSRIDRIEKVNDIWTRYVGYYYLREENNILYNFPNDTLLNYLWNDSTTIVEYDYAFIQVHVVYSNVFDVNRLTYYLYIHKPYEYVSYTDSIGFNALHALEWRDMTQVSRYLIGCIIDNKTFGEILTEIKEADIQSPKEYKLSQNYPNPFNPTTKITYQIPNTGFVTLKVYDILGRELVTLINEEKPAGNYEVTFNGQDLPSGIYFYKLQAGDYSSAKKMILMK